MHLWIKIEGTLEKQLECMHTHTSTFQGTQYKETFLTSTTCPYDTNSNVSPSIGRTLTSSYMQYTVYRVAFPLVPCCSGLPGKEEAPPGSAPLGQAGLLATAMQLRWMSLWRERGGVGGLEWTNMVKGKGYTAEIPADDTNEMTTNVIQLRPNQCSSAV